MDEANSEIKLYNSGVHNLLPNNVIPPDAASDEKNWINKDGRIVLVGGRNRVGDTNGGVGKITAEIFGYKANGETVHWRKAGTTIQFFDEDTNLWTTSINGLTATADYSATNYSSLAGNFTFFFGIDGIFKINNVFPLEYLSLYDPLKNFKGLAFINKGRSILWNRPEDKTGLYGSYIDAQDSTVYTTVTSEVVASLSGTLAFKSGNPLANCFGVKITVGAEVFTDNYLGQLVGSIAGTGTINYMTGVYTVSVAGAGSADYQYEESNEKGVTDFTHSATRLPGEGFQFPQDEGGDAILNVLIGPDDAYYSMKKKSTYRLFIAVDDTAAGTTNEVFRRQIAIQSLRGAVSMDLGIVFMDLANPEKPEFKLLEKDAIGTDVLPKTFFPQFKFANYNYDDCAMETAERFVMVACKTLGSNFNNVILLCNIENKTVDITYLNGRTFAKDSGVVYMGSSVSENVYKIFDGFDDDGSPVENFWNGKNELFQGKGAPAVLKKHRKIRLRGLIATEQYYEVYCNYDSSGPQLIGTVRGTGSYVDSSSPQAIGSNIVGSAEVGGDSVVNAYPYYVELKIKKPPKFGERMITFKALGIGYLDIQWQEDWGLLFFEDKIPARYRQKQNVSLDGKTVDLANPQF